MQRTNPYGASRRRLDAFVRELKGLYAGNVHALHRARVASRRLRELVPVLGLEAHTSRKLSRRLKKVTRQLGAVRELDVLIALTDELGRDARYSPIALERVRLALEAERAVERNRLTAKLPLVKMQRLRHRLERALEQRKSDEERSDRRKLPSSQAWIWAVEARTTRRATRARAAIEAACGVYLPGRLHEVRIALKKLRYAMELRAEARRLRATRSITTLKNAQDLLGRLHDLEVLIERARQTQASFSPPLVKAWRELGPLVRALEDDCRALHAHYMRDRTRLLAIANRAAALNADVLTDRRAVG